MKLIPTLSLFLTVLTLAASEPLLEDEASLPEHTSVNDIGMKYQLTEPKTSEFENGVLGHLMPTLSDAPGVDTNFKKIHYGGAIFFVNTCTLSRELETETTWACMTKLGQSSRFGPAVISRGPDARGQDLGVFALFQHTFRGWK